MSWDSFLGNVFGSLYGATKTNEANRLSFYRQKQLMEYQNELGIQSARDLAIRSPGWQVQGLRKANINPLLAYSGGMGVSSMPTPSASYSAQAPSINFGGSDLLGDYENYQSARQQSSKRKRLEKLEDSDIRAKFNENTAIEAEAKARVAQAGADKQSAYVEKERAEAELQSIGRWNYYNSMVRLDPDRNPEFYEYNPIGRGADINKLIDMYRLERDLEHAHSAREYSFASDTTLRKFDKARQYLSDVLPFFEAVPTVKRAFGGRESRSRNSQPRYHKFGY